MKYIIGADLSLSSSAICIYNGNDLKLLSYTNAKENNKWIQIGNDYIDYTFHKYKNSKDFTESEILKIKSYDKITDDIVNDIINYIGDNKAEMYIESYSYNAKAGKLIDLVSFGTSIRLKLLQYNNINMHFIPPSTLKKLSGEYVYEPDKKGIYRNENGTASGSFDKKDLYMVILNMNLNYPYTNLLNEKKDEMLNLKNIPKPFDDMNDALLIVYNGCKEHNIKI